MLLLERVSEEWLTEENSSVLVAVPGQNLDLPNQQIALLVLVEMVHSEEDV